MPLLRIPKTWPQAESEASRDLFVVVYLLSCARIQPYNNNNNNSTFRVVEH